MESRLMILTFLFFFPFNRPTLPLLLGHWDSIVRLQLITRGSCQEEFNFYLILLIFRSALFPLFSPPPLMTFLPARTDRRTIAMLLPVVVFPFAIYFERPTITTTITTVLPLLLYNSTITAITGNFGLVGTWTLAETLLCRYWFDNGIATHENRYNDDNDQAVLLLIM